jgi:hypothetical protein
MMLSYGLGIEIYKNDIFTYVIPHTSNECFEG